MVALMDQVRLMGATEAAEAIGVSQTNLRPLTGLPEPVAVLRCGTIWLADDIEAFAAERRQRLAA
jgi:hypothetical protein